MRAAFLRVKAADKDLSVALLDKLPRLNLAAVLSSSAEDASDLFSNWTRSLAADLVGPLVDGGRREAEAKRVLAVRRELLSDYAQTVLVAIQEVEDSLVREAKQVDRIKKLEEQIDLASQSYRQLRVEFLNGVSNYIDVLTALTVEQRLRRDLLTAERSLIEFRIALYRALAGGFDTGRARN